MPLASHLQSVTASGENGVLEMALDTGGGGDWRGEIRGGQVQEDTVKKLEIPEQYWEGMDLTKTGFQTIVELHTKQPVANRLFVDSILNDTLESPNFYDGLEVIRVVDAALRSEESGCWETV